MAVLLHVRALEYAKNLIEQGKFDLEGGWESNKPTPESENAYLANHSFREYGNWFLGFDPDADEDTKERYEFPIGNFNTIFRSGVVAAEHRAAQYGHDDIKKAAHELLEMMPK